MKAYLAIIFSLIFTLNLFAQEQDSIVAYNFILNPSFEGEPFRGNYSDKKSIENWMDCCNILFPNSSGIDVHGINTNYWEVSDRPSKGESYIGMVARDNEQWEFISQKLNRPLIKNHLYSFDIDVKLDNNLESITKKSGTLQRFDNPLTLKVYLANRYCGRDSLVYTSQAIDNLEWETIQIAFRPDAEYQFIILEAFSVLPVTAPYNDNIMIDNIKNMKVQLCK